MGGRRRLIRRASLAAAVVVAVIGAVAACAAVRRRDEVSNKINFPFPPCVLGSDLSILLAVSPLPPPPSSPPASLTAPPSTSLPATALPSCLSSTLTTSPSISPHPPTKSQQATSMLPSISIAPTSHTSKQLPLASEHLLLRRARLGVTVQKLILRQGLHNIKPRIDAKVDQFIATLIWIGNHSDKSCWNWRSGSSPIVATIVVADTQIRRLFACTHLLESGEAFNKSTAQRSPSSRARPVRQSKGPPTVLSMCRDEDPWCYSRGFPMVFAIAPKRPRRQHQTLVTVTHSELFVE